MGRILTLKVFLIGEFLTLLSPAVHADTYSVKIATESHVNLVDSRFLSFTIDPKYLFSSNGKYNTKECICMASSLTPAYIRIAGPSTSHTTFHNATISIDALTLLDERNSPQKVSLNENRRENARSKLHHDQVSVTPEEWEKFVHWAKNTGFDLVFALNNEEKTTSGMWDPNTALSILTVADKAKIGYIFWQLGYECNNQSIEEYLNDLETLRVITETFPSGKSGHWHVVGGDVTPCLTADSKSDFKDYVTLSDELFDAVFLNGNSSSQELERMSEKDRLKLLKVLSRSDTPLWLTETNRRFHELERAADWMTSLGYSARNGFAVHFRELVEMELYEPTLSFYMALLFKNLVGEKVLNVDIEASEATMFAHCTSLRHKPVPGAVTLYGANMDAEPARFSIKLSKREEGGDIMQFILGHDQSGNIVVNGRAMYYEGDIKPVVKRVRPYKTLLINLPPKSFGFWVLANTQVDACHDINDSPQKENKYVEALTIESDEDSYSGIMKSKRSINSNSSDIITKSQTDLLDLHNVTDLTGETKVASQTIESRIADLNDDLMKVQHFLNKQKKDTDDVKKQSSKIKRQADDEKILNTRRKKPRRQGLKGRSQKRYNDYDALGSSLISKLRNSKLGRKTKLGLNRVSKRNSKGHKSIFKSKRERVSENKEQNVVKRKSASNKVLSEAEITNPDCDSLRKRKRRSIETDNSIDTEESQVSDKKFRKLKNMNINHLDDDIQAVSSENEIRSNEEVLPVGKILHKLKKISRFPLLVREKENNFDSDESTDDIESDMGEIVLKTKLLDDSAVINISDKSKHGFLRSTIEEVLSVLADLNKNLSKIWSVLTFLE